MLRIYAAVVAGEDRHAAARELLRCAYGDLTGKQLPEICIDENGKPFILDDPLYFSLTYTAGFCFCALCDRPVGLDAEVCRAVKPALLDGVLSAGERQCLGQGADFMRFWTLKEAFCKYTGLGIANTKLRETEFDLTQKEPVLLGRNDLHFGSKNVDINGRPVIISYCTDKKQCAEFYMGEEKYAEF